MPAGQRGLEDRIAGLCPFASGGLRTFPQTVLRGGGQKEVQIRVVATAMSIAFQDVACGHGSGDAGRKAYPEELSGRDADLQGRRLGHR